ncbi:kinase-like protein [Fragilariopsis cylindrus CCMP1102]|uniref:Kinase-like protein n=1 Tax=Fragilariopsis cylindrus CCMP1102 TaxID=635003 RepID=A0A1E7EPR1_9STRA|nr:kinase-like protein [Fragilariopsis cylindrus CCMP1102]|eukprot:OEU07523.1 kinase-like protein [Fragilariopsis cylindrus CCMP1102]
MIHDGSGSSGRSNNYYDNMKQIRFPIDDDEIRQNSTSTSKHYIAEIFELPLVNRSIIYDDVEEKTNIVSLSSSSTKLSVNEVEETKRDNCIPMAKWMTASFPNCNSVHEMDMSSSVFRTDKEEDLSFLGQGWFRSAWKYKSDLSSSSSSSSSSSFSPAVVLKTLRIEREFIDEYFDLHRRDAVAMERLTFSPFVVNVHGYCGQSAINELAEGIVGGAIANLEQLDRRLRGKEEDPQALFLKLQLATGVSLGLAHIHNVHVSDERFGRSVPTMAHYDINPRNIAIMRDGSPKLNDFNIAEFMTYDPKTNATCGFRSRLHEPWWRAPEEMDMTGTTMVTEKVDVYALGEVMFHILTTHSPRGKMKKHLMEDARSLVREGVRPTMFEPFLSGGTNGQLKQNRIVKAFMKVMDLCYEKDPEKRGTAIQVARILHKALAIEERDRRTMKNVEEES